MADLVVPQGGRVAQHEAPTGPLSVRVEAGGRYDLALLVDGPGAAQIEVTLAGEGATLNFAALFLLRGAEAASVDLVVRHAAPGTTSTQHVRSIVDGAARAAFAGRVLVERGAGGANARQICRSLLLSPAARAETRPQMEICADDVACAHGATCGALDEGALFYLRARGVPEEQARRLLLEGFAAAVLADVTDGAARAAMQEKVAAWLGG